MWMRESVELFAGWVCMDYGSSLLQSWPDEEKWAPIIQKLRNTYTKKKHGIEIIRVVSFLYYLPLYLIWLASTANSYHSVHVPFF